MITASIGIAHKTNASCFEISESRYSVRIARTAEEVESALRLRFSVFKRELSRYPVMPGTGGMEFDAFDFKCDHLIVVENDTGRTVGTYRLNSIETAGGVRGFYSYGEFAIESLPLEILQKGIEIGRACVARDHRNSKVLFLLWKGLAQYLQLMRKQYFFGCCSIFSTDCRIGAKAYRQLLDGGHLHKTIMIAPKVNSISCDSEHDRTSGPIDLPNLFRMYLKLGAKVCGPPMVDNEFGTIDFFVVFDVDEIDERHRSMFFRRN